METFGWETAFACTLAVSSVMLFSRWLRGPSREWLLTAVSAVVLFLWQPLALLITLALAGVTWLGLPPAPRISLGTTVALLVGTLAGFKYAPWLFLRLGGHSPFTTQPVAWVVPLGLSFTVFRLVGVVLDVNALRITLPLSRLALLSLFFPTLPAGPITTVRSLRISDEGQEHWARWVRAGWRIMQGMSRKVLMADPLYEFLVGPWLKSGVGGLEPYQCFVLPVFFGLYIYWDFAGYSDIAIGMALLLGYQVPENFNRPYSSRNLIEFWRRWHITLSEWIWSRLMVKMAGRRATTWRLCGATMASMILCGIWHGTGLGYLVWGVWHGIGLVGVHLFSEARRRNPTFCSLTQRVLGDTASLILTFAFVTVGWTFFFLSPTEAVSIMSKSLQWRAGGSGASLYVPLAVVVGLLTAHWGGDHLEARWRALPPFLHMSARAVLLAILAYVMALTNAGRQDFCYVQF